MSGRFDDRATQPVRGPGDVLRWKLGRRAPRRDDWAQIDAIRPGGPLRYVVTARLADAPVSGTLTGPP